MLSTIVNDVESPYLTGSRHVANRIIVVLLLIIPLSQIALDAYTPALP